MPPISLTTFVDFVIKSGTPRITCVRDAKKLYAEGYSPVFDFWKALREAIVELQREGRPKSVLSDLLGPSVHPKKRESYAQRIESYRGWMGRKDFEWTGCRSVLWESGGLSVNVNPELGMRIDGEEHVIKLYFKKDKPSKRRLETMLHLIGTTLPAEKADATPGILDVKRGGLFTPTVAVADIDALLVGEAAAFVAMWNQV